MNITSDTAAEKPASTTYPVFKGLGRKPTFFGVPTTLLFGAFMLVAVITMLAGLAWWGLLLVILPTIAIVTRHDDKAFDVLWLEAKTRARNRNKRFWNGSSYSPLTYHRRRPWRTLVNRRTQP